MNFYITKVDWHARPLKREMAIFAGMLFFFFIFFMRSCWYPSTKAISAVKSELNDIIKEKSELESQIDVGGAPAVRWQGTLAKRAEYAKMAQKFSDSPNIVILREFSNPAVLRGLKLVDIKFDEIFMENGALIQPWKLSLFGSFVSVGAYIERLESLPMLLIIDNINIKTSNDPLGHVNAEVTGEGYGWK